MLALNQLDHMLEIAQSAARQAGQHALSQMHQTQARIKDGTTGKELVTQVDRECQDMIVAFLHESFPEHGFLGEEGDGGITKIAPQTDPGVTWVIDPIDGTNNFAHHVGLYAVCVAAMFEGRPVVGVIYDPNTDQMYHAHTQSPAFCNDQKLDCGDEALSPFVSVAMDSHIGDEIPHWMGRLMMRCRFRNLGTTALHLAMAATGGFAASVQIMPKLWDIAAGTLIAERAGAKVTTDQGLDLWPLDMKSYQGGPLPCVVGNPTAHQAVIEHLTK